MSNSIRVHLNSPRLTMRRIANNRRVGMFMATTWHRYFDKFTPMDSGTLKSNVTYEPFKIHYNSPYAHYVHEGIKYDDPQINASGWFDEEQGRWFSHAGVTKIRTNEKLTYSHEQSPLAQAYWEKAAYKAHKKEVARQITRFLERI